MAAYKKLSELIDKFDTVEIVRDKIAWILVNESNNQQNLALELGRDPNPWAFDVTIDRSNPFEKWLNDQNDRSPIINVWFDSGSFNKGDSDVVRRQKIDARFNIDCYGLGISKDIAGGGHELGDENSSREAHRTMRLARNILMASTNTYLQLRGLVWGRWTTSIELFQPRFDNNQGLQVTGARIILNVEFNEFSPQFKAPEIEGVSVDIKRDDCTGFLLAETEYNYLPEN